MGVPSTTVEGEEVVQGGGGTSPRRQGQGLAGSPRGPAVGGGGQWERPRGAVSTPINSDDTTRGQGQGKGLGGLQQDPHEKGKENREKVLRAVCGYVLTCLPSDLFNELFKDMYYPMGDPHGHSTQHTDQWHHLPHQPAVQRQGWDDQAEQQTAGGLEQK